MTIASGIPRRVRAGASCGLQSFPSMPRSRIERSALAGAISAAVWCVGEQVVRRAFRTPFSDARLLGAPVTRGPLWWPVGAALHTANGAAFGAAFGALGARGWRQGVVAAQIENVAAWPLMAAVDRFHPDVRSGAWPPILR